MPEDIRVKIGRLSLRDHRKTEKLIKALGMAGPTYLLFLWIRAAETRPKGVLTGYTEDDIALDAKYDGDPRVLVEALLNSGFLDRNRETGEYALHDWKGHQPWIFFADRRSEQAVKRAFSRWHGSPKGKKKEAPQEARKPAPKPTTQPKPKKARGEPPVRQEPAKEPEEQTAGGRSKEYWIDRANKHGPIRLHKGMEKLGAILERWGVPIEKEGKGK
jgi:hypothetical protein